ncbi:MAG: hypothetical protein EBW90_12745 [Rhodobacteraceae bacterium]|nr:hypothetical protein [Paracoccaceae bacterium]
MLFLAILSAPIKRCLFKKEGNIMYATSADWWFTNAPDFSEQEAVFTANMKAAGAIHWYYVLTSETTARSMVIWPDQATSHKSLKMVRDDAAAENNQVIVSVCEGDIVAGF